MFEIQTFTVLLCATSVLTSTVTETDGSINETRLEHAKNVHESLDSAASSKSEIKLHGLSDDNAPLKIMGEGGPIYRSNQRVDSSPSPSKAAPSGTVVSEDIKITTDDLIPSNSESREPKIRNPSVVPRKGVVPPSKIAARKGVNLESSIQDVSSSEGVDEALSRVEPRVEATRKAKIERVSSQKSSDTKNRTVASTALPVRSDVAIHSSDGSSSGDHGAGKNPASTTESSKVEPTTETKLNDTSTTLPTATTRRFKPKPTVTTGEKNVDKPIPPSPTKTPPLGMPRKIDYIVPVIITIMALPLLGGVTFFMYRRGRDCWDKRHYRRMDFLIDGMYNDHTSWK